MNNKNTSRSSGSPKPKKRPPRSKGPRPKKKREYRIRNWSDYDTALVNRGRLTLWLDPAVLQDWYAQGRTGGRGKPRLYSDQAIACALRLGSVYRLPLRATEGLLASQVALAGAPVPAPVHLVVDGTGLKVFGDGEWKVRQHGTSKRRVWRKVHLAVDERTGMIHAAATTDNSISDGQMLPALLA